MQRRTAAASHNQSFSSLSSGGTTQGPASSQIRKRKRSANFLKHPAYILIALALSISGLSFYLFPNQVATVEHEVVNEAKLYARKAVDAEHRVETWLHQGHGATGDGGASAGMNRRIEMDATEAMMSQGSGGWVDGERKLKKKLKELMERQAQGKDVGVPVLTRWLGDDFPAWAGEGVDRADWEKKRDERYEQMRKEEEAWQARMQRMIDTDERNIGISTM